MAKQSNELRIYSTIGGMRLIYNDFFEIYKDVIKNQRKGKHEGVKWVTSIYNKQDIEIVTIFLNEGINVHHVKSVPFYILYLEPIPKFDKIIAFISISKL